MVATNSVVSIVTYTCAIANIDVHVNAHTC